MSEDWRSAHPEFGTLEAPVIGHVPWNGSIYLDAPAGLSPAEELQWRLDYDLVWVMENLVTILDKKDNRAVPFKLNPPQCWAMWNLIEMLATGRPSWGWFLKGRQFGYSTLFITVLFICALRGKNGLLLAHLEKPGRSIFRKPELALAKLPTFELKETDPETGEETVSQVISLVPPPTSKSGESLLAWSSKAHNAVLRRDSAEIRDAGVGETFQNAQFTEVPLYPDAAHTIGHLIPALSYSVNTFVNGEFTARVEGDYAHNQWLEGMEPDGIFRSVFAAWYWMGSYREVRRSEDRALNPREEAVRAVVARTGSEYPLTDAGRLKPRFQEIYDRNGRISVSDLEVGVELDDEQLLFLRKMLKAFAGDEALLRSEFPNSWAEAFRAAQRKLVPPEVMEILAEKQREPLEGAKGVGEYTSHMTAGGKGKARWQPRRDGRVHRFELPKAGATYVGWADPSSGAGIDPTGAGVWRVEFERCVLVASFEGFERPHNGARILARFGRHYRDGLTLNAQTKKLEGGRPCELAVERNNHGEAFITELQRLKYPRIWRYSDRTKDNARHGHDYGFPTYKDTKNPMLNRFVQAAFDGQIEVPCRRALQSWRNMQFLDDTDEIIGAPRGQHDDLAMGSGIGFWAASEKAAFRLKPVEDVPEWLQQRVFERAG